MTNKFIARYNENGINKSILFDKSIFTEESAKQYLSNKGIQNFFFFFEPYEPTPFGDNSMIFKGDVGFDITTEKILPYINEGKEIILDSGGGDLYEGWKIHDAIKLLNINPSIGVLGICASATTLILTSTENSWMSENSQFLIHNPFSWQAGDDEDMRAMANSLEKEKVRLASHYSNLSEKTQEEILSLMKEEKFLTAQETLNYKFIKTIKSQNTKEMKNENQKEIKESLSKMEQIFASVKALFKPKNLIKQDVNGVEIDFGEAVQTPEQIAVGVTATIDGKPAEGEYTIDDGTIYVFKAGTLEEIKQPNSMEVEIEALKAENEALKAENALKVEAHAKLKNEFDAFKTESESKFKNLNAEFTKFKNQFTEEPIVQNEPNNPQSKNRFEKFKNNK